MNTVVLIGRLTKEPDVRRTQSGMAIARYTLAVDRVKRDEADFISCVAFDKAADFVQMWLHKGTKICVIGRLQTGSYTNKDGQKVYTTDVVVQNHEFCESRKAGEAAQPDEGFADVPADMQDLPFA